MNALEQAVEQVRVTRKEQAEYQRQVARLREAFEQTIAHLVTREQLARTDVALAESHVRTLGLVYFEADRTNKHPAPGVVVKLMTTLEYDVAAALAWATEKNLCLIPAKLDDKAFAKIAKATPLPFVTERETAVVTIASDLPAPTAAPIADAVAQPTEAPVAVMAPGTDADDPFAEDCNV